MEQLVGVLVIAAVVVLLLLLSRIRRRRVQPYVDAFAAACCEAAEHLLGGTEPLGRVRTEALDDGRRRLLPAEQQPEKIRALLEAGVDEYALARMRSMFALRQSAQERLSAVNLIGDRINGVLNRVYDLFNLSLSIIHDPCVTLSADEERDFDFFLNQQAYLRGVTLAAVVSEACKATIVDRPKQPVQ